MNRCINTCAYARTYMGTYTYTDKWTTQKHNAFSPIQIIKMQNCTMCRLKLHLLKVQKEQYSAIWHLTDESCIMRTKCTWIQIAVESMCNIPKTSCQRLPILTATRYLDQNSCSKSISIIYQICYFTELKHLITHCK